MNILVKGIPGPVIPFCGTTDLQKAKIDALLARVRTLQSICALQMQQIKELRRDLDERTALADELAQELESVYGLQDQGACALAAVAAEEEVQGNG